MAPRVIYGADGYVSQWVAAQLGQTGFAGNLLNAFGVFDGQNCIGGTVFHNHYPKEGIVEMSSACVRSDWLSRAMIRTIFNYAFCVLGCQMVVMRVSSINHRMVNIAKRFGFNSYLIPRLRGKDEDEIVFTLTDDQWRSSRFNRSK